MAISVVHSAVDGGGLGRTGVRQGPVHPPGARAPAADGAEVGDVGGGSGPGHRIHRRYMSNHHSYKASLLT